MVLARASWSALLDGLEVGSRCDVERSSAGVRAVGGGGAGRYEEEGGPPGDD